MQKLSHDSRFSTHAPIGSPQATEITTNPMHIDSTIRIARSRDRRTVTRSALTHRLCASTSPRSKRSSSCCAQCSTIRAAPVPRARPWPGLPAPRVLRRAVQILDDGLADVGEVLGDQGRRAPARRAHVERRRVYARDVGLARHPRHRVAKSPNGPLRGGNRAVLGHRCVVRAGRRLRLHRRRRLERPHPATSTAVSCANQPLSASSLA